MDTNEQQRRWNVSHQGRDAMYYEEFIDGSWQRLDLDAEMLCGRAHHLIYFASPEQWQRYPDWAQGRREEIIARIKSRLGHTNYEYDEAS